MRINVARDENGAFVLSFDDTMVTLGAKDLKVLLLEIMQVFGGAGESPLNQVSHDLLFARLKEADDVSLQTLIQVAEHDDMVALVKLGETDEQLQQKLFQNMSDNNRKIFQEDAAYRFKETVPPDQVSIAILRLTQVCETLRDEGRADI